MSLHPVGSRRSIRTPKYRHHTHSGQAVVTINGKDVYLGKYGTLESHEQYHQVVGQFLAEQGRPPLPARDNVALLALKRNRKPITVVEACSEYLRFCEANRPNEVSAVESMQAVFVSTFRHELAANIGPVALKQVREAMVESGHMLAKQKSDRKKRQEIQASAHTLVTSVRQRADRSPEADVLMAGRKRTSASRRCQRSEICEGSPRRRSRNSRS